MSGGHHHHHRINLDIQTPHSNKQRQLFSIGDHFIFVLLETFTIHLESWKNNKEPELTWRRYNNNNKNVSKKCNSQKNMCYNK